MKFYLFEKSSFFVKFLVDIKISCGILRLTIEVNLNNKPQGEKNEKNQYLRR